MSKALGGRPVQPAALALMLAALVAALGMLPGLPWHDLSHTERGLWSDWIIHGFGIFALAIAALFMWSWWKGSHRCLDRALQGSTVLWLWAAALAFLNGLPPARGFLSLAWAILAAGSAWLEEGDDDARG